MSTKAPNFVDDVCTIGLSEMAYSVGRISSPDWLNRIGLIFLLDFLSCVFVIPSVSNSLDSVENILYS